MFRVLQSTLFKNVIVSLPEDAWQHLDVGTTSQPAAEGETHFFVSKEYVACQVHTMIDWGEKRLQAKDLPLDTVIRKELADRFLEDAKNKFHASKTQQQLQQKDRDNRKRVKQGIHSR